MDYEVYYASEKSPEVSHKVNEDHCVFSEISFMKDHPIRLIVIADGMGGLFEGREASRNALIGFSRSFYTEIVRAYADADMLNFSLKYTIREIRSAMIRAVEEANREICKNADPFLPTGSTISAICLIDDCAVIANIGDSPVYYYQKKLKRLSLISEIQTKAELEAAAGAYERYSDAYYASNHVLSASLGEYSTLPESMVHVEIVGGIRPGDLLLAGSDGAFGNLRENVITTLLEECGPGEGDFLLRQLFELSGIDHQDDQTAILYAFTERGTTV